MPNEPQFPSGFVPYESVTLCGNTLRGGGVIFQIGDRQPLWIGKGTDLSHPQVWISAMQSDGNWIDLVMANVAVRPSIYPSGATITVIQDAGSPRTVVLAGTMILVDAVASADGSSVAVPSIDLRPLGLNIFGNTSDGLSFGGTRFAGNNFVQVGAAFASTPLVGSSERQDAYREMIAAGFDPSDFQISERVDRPTTIEYAVTGKAIVTRVSSGVTRTYDAGHGTAWVVELSRDLRAGVYGQPPRRWP